jgi:hypothetical protein
MDDTMITPDKEEQTYIHFGADHFIPELFCPIRNHTWMDKPMGGLWASRVDDEFGWNQWCRENRYKLHNLKHSFCFRLMDAQILTLYSPEQLTSLPLLNLWKPKKPLKVGKGERPTEEQLHDWVEPNVCHLDYEKLAEKFDAIELRNSLSFRKPLSTWDCDCILAMNPEKIIEL